MSNDVIVVPCFNEEKRLDTKAFSRLSRDVRLLFVNDGSTDGTLAVLEKLAGDRISILSLAQNQGKAEAVRQGLQHATKGRLGRPSPPEFVGFADSDLATPPEEILRLLATAHDSGKAVVLGSRVALAGAAIERKMSRHYLGRVFASVAQLALPFRFYDTQCGAKVFRNTPELAAALADPFLSRWIFDVELLGRLTAAGYNAGDFLEMPLRIWRDVHGSKVTPRAWARAAFDLARIARDLQRRKVARAGKAVHN